MVKAWERLINLAIALASKRDGITAEEIRALSGYPDGQEDAAFIRMFERDKSDLREAGFVIDSTSEGLYRLNAAATFAGQVDLTAEETAAVRVVGVAMLEDPSFPYPDELRLALAKIATALEPGDAPAVARNADEDPAQQGKAVAELNRAISARKRATFGYTNSYDERRDHTVEPLGVFAHDGRWYLVARDVDIDEIRVYAIVRMRNLATNDKTPETPDFSPPADFDVHTYTGLPFQYGRDEPRVATLGFSAGRAWNLDALTARHGEVERLEDGSALWRIPFRNERGLLRWIVANGPGVTPVEPESLAGELARLLGEVERVHSEGEVA